MAELLTLDRQLPDEVRKVLVFRVPAGMKTQHGHRVGSCPVPVGIEGRRPGIKEHESRKIRQPGWCSPEAQVQRISERADGLTSSIGCAVSASSSWRARAIAWRTLSDPVVFPRSRRV